ncbi:protein arginine N-methyltransferase 7 [Harmonia axyridis]|uniref:protein arginine N-methyltransferase 7 n=1 Tax=Harmonia axyridis TaxID=115357 RepID=UPI001E278673|nr:protein arginine N-methyltransferase 7 [Harmonia axyridis]
MNSKMDIFVQKNNVLTGLPEWEIENADYDYHQEIARSSFADMLHDTERNQKYEAALKIAIEKIHKKGQKAIVLDIGTGTGLLSMMAVRNGADKVTACEGFEPMSVCALEIIKLNGFENKIKVIPKRSINLTVGKNCDLDEKCNILVTEVFDTELIGECALSTFNHAHHSLLTEDCIVIPHSATMYAQVVECPIAHEWNRISDIYEDGELLLKVSDNIKNCTGSAALYDFQLSQLPKDSFKTLMKPTPIFEFDWTTCTPLKRSTVLSVQAECDGEAQAVFMWWDLKMDTENKIILSCAPYWDHPSSKSDLNVKIPWRDHWMQAVYYFPKEIVFIKGEELNLLANHDEYSLWFNIKKTPEFDKVDYRVPSCNCSVHILPRTRIGQMNDKHRYKVLMDNIKNKIAEKDILVLSNGCHFSLICSKLNSRKIYIFDNNTQSRKILLNFISVNEIKNVALFENIENLLKEIPEHSIDVVLAEPYFLTSILPWDNLYFYFSLRRIRSLLKENVQIYPKAACIKAIAVCFDDLHKIRTPLKECEGFKMENFDNLIKESSRICDELVEPQPLWEYPGIAVSSVEKIVTLQFSEHSLEFIKLRGTLKIEDKRACNGIAFWVDWLHGNDIITTGAIVDPEIGKKIMWDRNSKQGVCLFETKYVDSINYYFTLDLILGDIKFEYK